MSFTIPNEADAGNANQAEPDKVDFDILAEGSNRNGVDTGCAVSPQGSPDQTVAVAAGHVFINGLLYAVAAGNVSMAAADATNPRFDLVWVDNTGAKGKTDGTAAAEPVFPAIPSNSVILAVVYRAANDNTIAAADIVDKRIFQGNTVQYQQSTADMATRATTALADITDIKFTVRANRTYNILVQVPYSCYATTGIGVRIGATFPAGMGIGAVTGPTTLSAGALSGGTFTTSGASAALSAGVIATGSTRNMAFLNMIIRPTANGTVQIQYGAEVGTTTGAVAIGSRVTAICWDIGG